jgi:hypothetical protein
MNIFKTIIDFLGEYIHLHFLTKLILIASFVVSFLTIFFFTYGKKMEEQIVMQNIDYLIDEMLDGYVDALGDKQKKMIYDKINEMKMKDMSKEDELVINNNKELYNKSIYILIGILVSSIFITSIISYVKNFKYLEIIMQNIVLLLFVGICEFMFLVFFGSKFISANVNFIKGKIASFFYIPTPINEELTNNKLMNLLIKISLNDQNMINYINENPEIANAYIDKIKLETTNFKDLINQNTTSSNI